MFDSKLRSQRVTAGFRGLFYSNIMDSTRPSDAKNKENLRLSMN